MQKLRALFLGLALLPLLGAQAPPTRPDLDVAFISFTPRYPAYEVHYPDGLPQSLHPETGKPLVAEDADAVQRWPRKGELVTATARVVNHGGAPSGPFLYTWLVNGKKVAEGRHAGLAAECMALPQTVEWKLKGRTFRVAPLRPESVVELTYPFKWRRPGYSLELRVRPETAGLEEISAENNSRVERTDALGLAVLIHRRAYNEWARTPGPLGTYSFEDWVQHQVELLRRKFADAIYPSAPRGVEQAIRIDTIRVLADGEDAAAFEAVAAVNGWDGVWSYGPERRTEATQDATAADGALFDELGRQLGLIDLEVLSVRPEANAVRDALTGQPVGVGYRLPVPALTRSPAEVSLPEHSVLALNRLKGQRRGYRGTYLYDIPRSCRVRVLDNNGRPVPEADVSVYQAERGEVRPEPVAAGRTSADGVYALPNRPAPAVETETGATLRANPFGKILVTGENGLLLLRIAAREQVEYQWLPITTFNVAYWRGQTTLATFDLRTRFPAPGAPAAPARLTAKPLGFRAQRGVLLEWSPVEERHGVLGYFIYRARYPAFEWERMGAVTALRASFLAPLPEPGLKDAQIRYAVTAADGDGNESGLSPQATVLLAPAR